MLIKRRDSPSAIRIRCLRSQEAERCEMVTKEPPAEIEGGGASWKEAISQQKVWERDVTGPIVTIPSKLKWLKCGDVGGRWETREQRWGDHPWQGRGTGPRSES